MKTFIIFANYMFLFIYFTIMKKKGFDIYLKNGGYIYVCNDKFDVLHKKDIGITGRKISFIGEYKEGKKYIKSYTKIIDLKGKIVLPGFIDAHTHPVYAGDREEEFEQRLSGEKYLELLKEKKGILYTVLKTRDTDEKKLKRLVKERFKKFLSYGTLTLEAKTGYGLSVKEELKHLKILHSLKKEIQWIDIKITALFAHAVPFEMDKKEYIREIIEYGLKEASRYADFCDVFVEKGVYTKEEGKKILLKAKEYGLIPRIHADELTLSGGAELACEIGAMSADHLEHTKTDVLKKMKSKGVVPVLLPSTAFFMRVNFPDGKKMLNLGLKPAIATDHNPGTSFVYSPIFPAGLAIFLMGFSIEDALKGITINAAKSLGIDKKKGSIEIGKDADIVIFDIKRVGYLFYDFYEIKKPVIIIKNGKEVVRYC